MRQGHFATRAEAPPLPRHVRTLSCGRLRRTAHVSAFPVTLSYVEPAPPPPRSELHSAFNTAPDSRPDDAPPASASLGHSLFVQALAEAPPVVTYSSATAAASGAPAAAAAAALAVPPILAPLVAPLAAPPSFDIRAPDGLGHALAWALPTTVQQAAVAAVAAVTLVTAQVRVRGSSRGDLVTVQESGVHGRGVVARRDIAAGTIVGSYPGIVRTSAGVCEKVERAPACKAYVFSFDDSRFLDPTDEHGCVSRFPAPSVTWPIPIDPTMAYVNEPPPGGRGPNLSVVSGSSGIELLFFTTREVASGEELFIDYGMAYDRSQYAARAEEQEAGQR